MDIESIVKEMKHDIIYSTPGYEEQHKKYCIKCALESYATSQREMRKGLEKLRDKTDRRRCKHMQDGGCACESVSEEFAEELSAILEGKV